MLLRDHALHCAKPSGSRMSGPSATLESSEHRDPFRPPAGHLGRRAPLPVVPRAGGLGHRAASCAPGRPKPSSSTSPSSRATSSPPRPPAPARPRSPCASPPNCAAQRVIDRITVVAPTDHLKRQWADAAARAGIRLDPGFRNAHGQHAPALPRRRRDLRAGGDAAGAAPRAHDLGPHPRDPRRGAPRRRRALAGATRSARRSSPRPGGSRSPARRSAPTPRPSRSCTTSPTRRASASRRPTTTTATGAPSPTASCARCCSWSTPGTCGGAPRPATRWRRGSARTTRRTSPRRPGARRSSRPASGSRRCCRRPTAGSPRCGTASPTPAGW